MGDDNGNGICFGCGFLVGVCTAVSITIGVMNARWETAIVEKGFAHYDTKTRAFVWSEPTVP